MIAWTYQHLIYYLYLDFIIIIKYIEIIYNLESKKSFVFKCNRLNGCVRVQNGKAEQPSQ